MSTPKKVKAMRRQRGEQMVLEINAIFPQVPLSQIIKAVKGSDLNKERAVATLLQDIDSDMAKADTTPPKVTKPDPKPVVPIPEPKISTRASPDATSTLEKGIKSVAAILPHVPVSRIIEALKQAKGDSELAILKIVESPDFEDADIDPEEIQSASPSESEEEVYSDEGFFANEWFTDKPLLDLSPEYQPDLLSLMYQEQADEELARQLQEADNREYRHETTPLRALPFYNARQRKRNKRNRYYEHKHYSAGGAYSSVPRIVVDPNLERFLNVQAYNNAAKLTNAVPGGPKKVFKRRRITMGRRLNLLQQKLANECTCTSDNHKHSLKHPGEGDVNWYQNTLQKILDDAPRDVMDIDTSNCMNMQAQELEDLVSVFGKEMTISRCSPPIVQFKLFVHEKYMIFLCFTLPVDYPNSPPHITIRRFGIATVPSNETMNKLKALLDKKATAEPGKPIIKELVGISKTFFVKFPAVAQEVYEFKVNNMPPEEGMAMSRLKKWHFLFDLLPPTDGHNSMIQSIVECRTAVGLEESDSVYFAILRQFGWNSKQFIEEYDSCKKNKTLGKFLDELGLVVYSKESRRDIALFSAPSTSTVECPSCLDDCDPKDVISLECGHSYCIPCWKQYLKVGIKEGKVLHFCPAYKCSCQCSWPVIARLAEPDDWAKLMRYLRNDWCESNRLNAFCPSQKCQHVVTAKRLYHEVVCKCGNAFCMACGNRAHYPADCKQLEWWIRKNQEERTHDDEDDVKSIKWLLKFTQDCPECDSPIQKNGGCNHMSCRKCNYQFCWICLGKWTGGSHYNCKNKPQKRDRMLEERNERDFDKLSFHQYYLLFSNLADGNDPTTIGHAIKMAKTKKLSVEETRKVYAAGMDLIMGRNLMLSICIAGMFDQKLGLKIKPLKKFLKIIANDVSFLSSSLYARKKFWNIQTVSAGSGSLTHGISLFHAKYSNYRKENEEKRAFILETMDMSGKKSSSE